MDWEDRLRDLWLSIKERFATRDSVLLGTVAHLAGKLGIDPWLLRVVLFVVLLIWPLWTSIGYILVSFFVNRNDSYID